MSKTLPSSSSSSPPIISMKDALKPLHPKTHKPTLHPSQRFTHLLLEHGEKHLQCWAVIASSYPTPPSPQQQQQLYRKSSSIQSYTTTSTSEAELQSTGMGRIEGRLRLCSRSIVFEPKDCSRGIIRCPFCRMPNAPEILKGYNPFGEEDCGGVGGSGGVAVVKCERHLVMKANNVIAPFECVEVPVVMKFTFLHSSPDHFLELAETLFQMVKANNGTKVAMEANSNALDQILKPMLDRPFDPSNFLDVREKPLTVNLRCSLLTPLLSDPGCAIVTEKRIYFQPADNIVSAVATTAKHWVKHDILATARRYNGLKDSAVELFWVDGSSTLLAFESRSEREQVLNLLPPAPCHTSREFLLRASLAWQHSEITNFEYLLALNSASGRTYSDLSRYPVFPWVIADYKSSKLDLSTKTTYRDLTKPVGALDSKRLEYFLERLKGMQDMDQPFLYGTHYSAPGYVLYYLVRSMPEHMLCLQNGKFDTPDRLFHGLEQCYSSVLINHADVKELIPEFFSSNTGFDFLINARSLQLGATQTGERVNDVKLPAWARSPRDFLKKNRKALESEICTRMLPDWIDLIFGFKSRGEEALKARNLFHGMAYVGPKDWGRMKSEEERMQAELQATEFGIVPDLLFGKKHPSKGEEVDWERILVVDEGRSVVGGEEQEEDLGKKREQPWELLDDFENIKKRDGLESAEKSQSNAEKAAVVSPTVGLGTGTLASSSKLSKYADKQDPPNETKLEKNKPLATAGGKAKASWLSNFASRLSMEPDNEEQQPQPNSSPHVTSQISNKKLYESAQSLPPLTSSKTELKRSHTNYSASSENSMSRMLLSGSSDTHHRAQNRRHVFHQQEESNGSLPSPDSFETPSQPTPQNGYELKRIASKTIHSDAVSGCNLSLSSKTQPQSYLTTVSLDGSLAVHTLPSNQQTNNRRSFSGANKSFPSKLSFLSKGIDGFHSSPTSSCAEGKLQSYRSHASADPLACLAVTSDRHGGHVVFAGGHDDVVFAYGVTSACAVASVYSHRDAVTGLDLFHRTSSHEHNTNLLMISGSWDATVKVWGVALAAGETVSINREPLAELFDADSSIVSLGVGEVVGVGIAICAGCEDGSFVVWSCRDDGGKEVIYKEGAKRGNGPCAAVKWTLPSEGNEGILLFTGFATGKVASYSLKNGILRPLRNLSLESPVRCLEINNNILFVGCADGSLRAIPFRDEGTFDSKLMKWNAVNGSNSPELKCIDVAVLNSKHKTLMIVTGAEDGSVVLSELKDTS